MEIGEKAALKMLVKLTLRVQLIDDNLKQSTLCLLLQHKEINGLQNVFFFNLNQKYNSFGAYNCINAFVYIFLILYKKSVSIKYLCV
jgi:hypothetical protein